ncbi:MAG: family 16 glycosylhydrolase [Planctomycetota bacterium]|nr:family 16 glycosylhydrolase [Planctomycetota bacterium]
MPLAPRVPHHALAAVLCTASTGLAQLAWIPVWADEFDGTALNAANWEVQTGTGTLYGLENWGNNELQYYTGRPQNLTVSNGMLSIIARAENYNNRSYTSARIRTLGRRDFRYGRFEARISVPAGQGLWPAFWMLPTNSPYGGWAASGEIDIIETINAATTAHGTIHHGSNWPNNTSNGGQLAGTYANTFRVYRVEWEPDEIRWYVDGVRYYRVTSATWFSTAAPANDRAPFDTPFHLLLNLAVGGNWPGNPNASTPFPSTLRVDYVRVSQRPPKGPYAGLAPTLPTRIEAEHFDLGGGSIAYNDTEPENVGNAFRPDEAVDIEACAEGGFNTGWFRPGEWVEYSVIAPAAGQYQVRLRVATQAAGAACRLASNGQNISDVLPIPSSGGWQSYRTLTTTVTLPQGLTALRLSNVGAAGADFNTNWIEFLIPGDVNANAVVDIDDLYDYESGGGLNRDVDGDGTPGTPFDRLALFQLVRDQ